MPTEFIWPEENLILTLMANKQQLYPIKEEAVIKVITSQKTMCVILNCHEKLNTAHLVHCISCT